ncbi:FAD-dependent oxidoreductase [Enemella sp. A6]|uniref:FAD-dependent oxidoreductase n=1 Tax=Enemella sp. A6 TaxID=3440152 RepID=UPI003EB8072C
MSERPPRPEPADPALFADAASPIVVVGGSLAGMAVAARLAHRGHHVVLLERSTGLGGTWARTGLPPVIELPAVWRDLFTKSGRALDATLTGRDLSWTTAPPARHRFADGTEVDWPTNRGDQRRVAESTWGSATAERWDRLLDDLGVIWQRLRTLGLEQTTDPARWRAAAPHLVPPGFDRNATVADLADSLGHPHPAALLHQVAWQRGQDPARLPAHHAVWPAVARIFGRWTLTDADGQVQPATVLLDLLTERLAQRGVELRTETAVTKVAGTTVTTSAEVLQARAVICAVTPQQWAALTRPGLWRVGDRARRRAAALPWAVAPLSEHTAPPPDTAALETVDHARRAIGWSAPVPITHVWGTGRPDPAAGPAWTSARTWAALSGPRIGSHYAVGPHTRSGTGVVGELFSAALAAYAVHADLTGEDIHPSNRQQPPRLRRRPGR